MKPDELPNKILKNIIDLQRSGLDLNQIDTENSKMPKEKFESLMKMDNESLRSLLDNNKGKSLNNIDESMIKPSQSPSQSKNNRKSKT